jgi:hypothetical protein
MSATEAYGNAELKKTQIYEWHKCFRDSRTSVKDVQRWAQTSIWHMTNMSRVWVLCCAKWQRKKSIQEMSAEAGTASGSVHSTGHKNLNMHSPLSTLGSKNPNSWTKINMNGSCCRPNHYGWSKFWLFQQCNHLRWWKSSRKRKFRLDKSKGKESHIGGFFDAQCLVHYEFTSNPERCTLKKEMYVAILRRLWDSVRSTRLEKWARNSWFLQHDNAGCQKVPIQAYCDGLKHSSYSRTCNRPTFSCFRD